jgi:hypothetical protein
MASKAVAPRTGVSSFSAKITVCPSQSVRNMLVNPVVVNNRVPLLAMAVAVSDACELTGGDG